MFQSHYRPHNLMIKPNSINYKMDDNTATFNLTLHQSDVNNNNNNTCGLHDAIVWSLAVIMLISLLLNSLLVHTMLIHKLTKLNIYMKLVFLLCCFDLTHVINLSLRAFLPGQVRCIFVVRRLLYVLDVLMYGMSIVTHVVIALDHYLAICHTVFYQRLVTLKRICILIALNIALCMALGVVNAIIRNFASLSVLFLLYFTQIIYCYINIQIEVSRTIQRIAQTNPDEARRMMKARRAVVTNTIVVFSFVTCLAPLQIWA